MAVWRDAGWLDHIWAGEMTAVNLGAAEVLWQFDGRTGRGVNPASACLHRYRVRLDGEQIFAGLREDE